MTEIWPIVLAAASAIVLLSNAAEKIVKAVKAAKAPEQRQDTEIDLIKDRLDKIEAKLENDNKQIKDTKEGSRVLTKGMLALLEHSLNGNNIEQMREARNDVNAYLINH